MEERTFADQAAHIHYLEAELHAWRSVFGHLSESPDEAGNMILQKRDELEAELTLAQETIAQLREQVAELRKDHPGHVVLTKRGDTEELVAVTRQDDEGRILSVLWEKPTPPHAETPTEMMDDVASYATKHLPFD